MRRGPGGVCGGPSGRSGLRGVRLGGGCGRSWGVPPGHRVRGLLRSVGLRPWGVRPALCGARALSPPRGRVGGSPPRSLPSGGFSVHLPGGVLVWWWLRLLGVGGVRSGARAPGCALGSGGAVVRLCGSARWWVVGAPVGAPFFCLCAGGVSLAVRGVDRARTKPKPKTRAKGRGPRKILALSKMVSGGGPVARQGQALRVPLRVPLTRSVGGRSRRSRERGTSGYRGKPMRCKGSSRMVSNSQA